MIANDHNLHTVHLPGGGTLHSTTPLTQAEAQRIRDSWPTPPPATRRSLRVAAQHAAQPRGLARLMNDTTWVRNAEITLGCAIGFVIACAIAIGFVVWASR